MDTNDLAMIAKAAELANRAHFTCKQVRKGTGLPYIIHPFRVATLVTEAGGDATQIAAAWCHDVLEDCDAFRAEANASLPAPVLKLVKELTKAEVSPGKRVKGAAFMAELRTMSPTAKLIKLCDRLDNLRDVTSAGDPVWAKAYAAESVEALSALTDTRPALGPAADRLVAAITTQIAVLEAWARKPVVAELTQQLRWDDADAKPSPRTVVAPRAEPTKPKREPDDMDLFMAQAIKRDREMQDRADQEQAELLMRERMADPRGWTKEQSEEMRALASELLESMPAPSGLLTDEARARFEKSAEMNRRHYGA